MSVETRLPHDRLGRHDQSRAPTARRDVTGGRVRVGGGASSLIRSRVLGPAAQARIVGVGPLACYIALVEDHVGLSQGVIGPRVIGIESAGGVGLPNSLRVAARVAPMLQSLRVGMPAVIGGGGVDAGSLTVRVTRWWDPRPPVQALTADRLGRAARELSMVAAEDTRPFGLEAAVERLATVLPTGTTRAPDACIVNSGSRTPDPERTPDQNGSGRDETLAAACRGLIGRGPGLTPAGDDVLAGLLSALRILGPCLGGRVQRHADACADRLAETVLPWADVNTTALSATLLMCADAGGVTSAAARLFRAVAGSGQLDAAAAELARIGHTSGRDLLLGIALGIRHLTTVATGSASSTSSPPISPLTGRSTA